MSEKFDWKRIKERDASFSKETGNLCVKDRRALIGMVERMAVILKTFVEYVEHPDTGDNCPLCLALALEETKSILSELGMGEENDE